MENLGDILKRLGTTRQTLDGLPPENGYEEPDEFRDSCQICGGKGWFTRSVPAGHPEFGQVVTCQCQEARLKEEQSARLLRYSNLGYLARFNFETLNPKGRADDPESQRLFESAHAAALEYVESRTGWLVFVGPNGSGKTHLAAAIANRCIDQGHPAFFVHTPDLLDHLRSSYAPASEVSYSDLFEQVKNTPLLVLDDLGIQSSTPWAMEKLRQIVNHRFSGGLPTIITTATELDEIDPYIRSRLQSDGLSRVMVVARQQQSHVTSLGRIDNEMSRRMTFDAFSPGGNNPSEGQRSSLEAAFQAAKNFAADPDGWLTLFGSTGVGKTHLAVAVGVERMNQGQPVFFAFVPELLDYLRYTFTPDSRVTYDRVFDEIKNAPLLILDDLGQEQSSPWANEKLYQIIVHRHNGRLPTVITSMMDFTDERGPISSRIQDPSVGQLIRLDAPDYRIKDKNGRRSRASKGRGANR